MRDDPNDPQNWEPIESEDDDYDTRAMAEDDAADDRAGRP